MTCTAQGAGFGERLSANFGFALDVMSRRGSGDSVRTDVARRFLTSDDEKQKRVLIYTFASRILSEGTGWKPVPLWR